MAKYSRSSSYTFANAPSVTQPRSTFDLSHGHKTAIYSQYLYPIMWLEVAPGDTIQCDPYVFGRLATPATPFMDNLWVDYFAFWIPWRQVHTNWEKVMGEREPDDTSEYYVPQMTSPAGGYTEESLEDYMGLPTKVEGMTHNSLPLRCYAHVWNMWFRAPHIDPSFGFSLGDGPDTPGSFTLLKRNKKHDYFAGALPAAQSGDPVTLPIGGAAPLVTTGDGVPTFDMGLSGVQPFRASDGYSLDGSRNAVHLGNNQTNVGTNVAVPWSDPKLEADLSSATAATVNSIRLAFQTQRFLEREMRSGNRYVELLRSFYGVTPDDQRLQRPELLSTGRTQINASAVPQTSQTAADPQEGDTPQGNLAAYATTAGRAGGFVKSFTEHGMILMVANLRADLSYQEGLSRDWTRRSRFDYMWPVFSMLGEQEIKNKEIQARGDANGDDDTWAFQERYAEYRYKPSQITGKFRSNATQSLEFWHLSEYFGNDFPTFNADFIKENPPVQRVLAVQDEPYLILDCHFKMKATRCLPTYSVPGMIDHF